jgi:hypothetical protein
MINLGDGGHRAFAAAARLPLFDADRRRNAGDQIHLRPRQLLDELPGIDIHRIQKPALPFGKKQDQKPACFCPTADAR